MQIGFFQWITAVLLAGALGTVSFAGAQKPGRADVALEAAAKKELVDGDVKGAIAAYQKIIAEYRTSDRAAVAKALVRMGQCYENLGVKEVAEARKAYERAVREYSDQKDAVATAQARLAALASPGTGILYRQVWAGPKVDTTGGLSSDGRYLTFVDWDTGNLALHDFSTGNDRPLTNTASWSGKAMEYAEQSTVSRDGKQAVYSWFNAKRRYELRILNIEAAGFPQPRQLFDDVNYIAPYDWSPDGRWIAVALSRKGVEVGLVSVQDGSLRVLKSFRGPAPQRMFFSPDGKYLGLDVSTDENKDSDISMLAVDGTGETKVVVNPGMDTMMGWSPDGKRLLFASDRTGSTALWGMPIAEGKPAGLPQLIKPEFASFALGMTAGGAMYVRANLSDRGIQVASLDFGTGKLLAPPVNPVQSFVGSNGQPDWSPDGKLLAYVSSRPQANGGLVLVIRSLETGQLRELRPALRLIFLPRWAPDGRSLITQGTDMENRKGIFRIDVISGDASPIVLCLPGGVFRFPRSSPDGKKIYYVSGVAEATTLIERDLASGSERELVRGWVGIPCVMPDGRHIAWIRFDPDKSETVMLVPLAGGPPRELLHLKAGEAVSMALSATADGRAVIVVRALMSGGTELLLVPIAGGEPRKLDRRINLASFELSMHPDGKQIAWASGEKKSEVWVLENFLPAAAMAGPGKQLP